jgi:hypothetical protein
LRPNRRNASKRTGPKTDKGKQRSRGNALRHGLTAETVIGTLEDAHDYKAVLRLADYYGDCAAPHASKPLCSIFRPLT